MRLTFAAFVLLSLAAFAQTTEQSRSYDARVIWEPPDLSFPQNLKANGKSEMLSSLRVSNYEIALERTEMKDVQKRLGGQLGSRGSDASEWLCFHGENDVGRWTLWLENDEINQGSVGSFQWWQASKDDVFDARCQALAKEDSMVILPVPFFALGATESQVLKSLGSPTARESERLIYLHTHGSGSFNSSNTVIVRLRNGLVWAIQAAKVTSD
jgi:hypothetical protein